MMTRVLRFLADDSGATAIEYAIIAGGVSRRNTCGRAKSRHSVGRHLHECF
jgi:hypothetical protein